MIILGINHFFHDTSACLVKDGELLVAVEEERFSRDKHTWSFPTRAIAQCFAATDIRPSDIDHVAVSINQPKNLVKKIPPPANTTPRAFPLTHQHFFRTGPN